MRVVAACLCMVLAASCAQPRDEDAATIEASLFGPTAMRIHPVFSGIKDWKDDPSPDGFEVLLEFQDRFGDPTKAAGVVIFELFEYRPGHSEPRGQRLENPWRGSIQTAADQRARWNRTSRTYTFKLEYPAVSTARSYVLTATFRAIGGGGFFSQMIFDAQEDSGAATRPTTRPRGPFGF